MPNTIDNLILDLIEWLARTERTYEETMSAWRTSCPRLTVWEDANDRGLVRCEAGEGRALVRPTLAGMRLLKERRPDIHGQVDSAAHAGPHIAHP